jgi:hypothetical protein
MYSRPSTAFSGLGMYTLGAQNLFATLHIPVNSQQSAMSIDLGLTNLS